MENKPVAQKVREIWSKIIEIVKYWKSLLKSKQPGYAKVSSNTSHDHLVSSTDDLLIPVKMFLKSWQGN